MHYCFNPRPCARGDFAHRIYLICVSMFQSTPLCEGRPALICPLSGDIKVSIHAPVRGATSACTTTASKYSFQSTPLCEGRRPFVVSDHVK